MSVPHWTGIVDTVLDRTVVPGYTRIGPRLRRHWWPADPEPGSLEGEHVVVTGASGGLGAATAEGLAQLGATVHLVGRNRDRLEASADDIRATRPEGHLVCEVCDVSDLDAVRGYAAGLLSHVDAIHSVVHNAGVMPPRRTESAQGHELALATHLLGPLLLTELLRPALRAAAGAGRVIWVSSGGMYAHPFTDDVAADLEYTAEEYDGTTAYARTKRMQVIVAEQLATRYTADGIAVHSMHPGWARTPGVTESLPRFARVMRPLLRSAGAICRASVGSTSRSRSSATERSAARCAGCSPRAPTTSSARPATGCASCARSSATPAQGARVPPRTTAC